jgi:hypothetical protein
MKAKTLKGLRYLLEAQELFLQELERQPASSILKAVVAAGMGFLVLSYGFYALATIFPR